MAKDTKIIEEIEKKSVDKNISKSKEKIRKIYIGPSFRDFNLRHGDIYILGEEEVPKLVEKLVGNCLKKQTEKAEQLKKDIDLIENEIKENEKNKIENKDINKKLLDKYEEMCCLEGKSRYFISLKEMFVDIKEYSKKIGNHSKSGTIENARFNIIQEGIEKGVYN